MPEETSRLRRFAWVVVPLVIGVVLVVLARRMRDGPEQAEVAERAYAVTVVEAPRVDVVPRVSGHGTSSPARRWRAVAQVRGSVVEVHPELSAGALLPAGAVVVRLDAAEHELSAARLRADVRRLEAQLAELAQTEENVTAALAIERESLALAERERDNLVALAANGAVTDTEVDAAKRSALAQRQAVQGLASQMAVLPAQREALDASLAATRASLAQAEMDVRRTVITTPFACRVGEVALQTGQFVAAGEALFEAHGTDVTEVEAQIPLSRFRPLVQRAIGGADLRSFDMPTLRERLDVEATVQMVGGTLQPEWPARFLRIRESVSESTRSGGFVVGVEDPYGKAVPGERPPLMAGVFCRVDFRGPALPGRIVVPRTALAGDAVYVADANDRLARRVVEIEFEQDGFAVIADGVSRGERVLVTPPSPAIDGMLLRPVPDSAAREALAAAASPARDGR